MAPLNHETTLLLQVSLYLYSTKYSTIDTIIIPPLKKQNAVVDSFLQIDLPNMTQFNIQIFVCQRVHV